MIAELTLEKDGAVRADHAALSVVDRLTTILAPFAADAPGIRLHGVPGLSDLLDATGPIGAIAAGYARGPMMPVRALLFDKTRRTNWSLGWHQDRTIAVRSRIDSPGFGPWTVKAGIQHVEPPFDIIGRMITLRVHLDPVPDDNAPLLVAPSSHRLGRIAESDIAATIERCGAMTCLADSGDVWVYATAILHASAAAEMPARRRVLQVDYSADELPAGLDWAGI